MLIPTNKHETKIKSFEQIVENNLIEQKISQQLNALQKPYSQQMKPWAIGAVIMGGVGIFFSFCTELGAIGYYAFLTVAQIAGESVGYLIAALIGTLVAGLIEYIKHHSNNSFWLVYVFKKRFEVARFVPVVLVALVSVFITIYACLILPNVVGTATGANAFDASKIEATKTEYLGKIAKIDADMAELTANGKKSDGRLRPETVAALDKLGTRRIQVEQQQDSTLSALTAAENDRIATAQNSQQKQGYTLAWISALLEIIFISAAWFGKVYLYKSHLERTENETPNETKTLSVPPTPQIIQLPVNTAVTTAGTIENETLNVTESVTENNIAAQLAELKNLTVEAVIKYEEVLAERQQERAKRTKAEEEAKPQRAQIGFKTGDTAAVPPAVPAKANYLLRVKEAEEKGLGLTIGGIYLCEWADCGKGFELNTYNKRFCSEACKLAARARQQQMEAARNEK